MAMVFPIFFYTSRPMAFRVIKAMIKMKFKLFFTMNSLIAVLSLLPLKLAFALIPEPDNLVFGTVTLDGIALTANDSAVSIVIRQGDVTIARYSLGDNEAAGNRYLLAVPTDSILARNPSANRAEDSLMVSYQSGAVFYDVVEFEIPERGEATELNLSISSEAIARNQNDLPNPGNPNNGGGSGGQNPGDGNTPAPLDSFGKPDSDEDGISDEFELANEGLSPFIGSDAVKDNDGDGVSNLDEYLTGTNVNLDDIAPLCQAPLDISIGSQGHLTAVSLGEALVTEQGTGSAIALASDIGPFLSGQHQVLWTCTDEAGNTSSDLQLVRVLPSMNFSADQVTGEGGLINVCLQASGEAVLLPVIVNYSVSGDALNPEHHNAIDGELFFDDAVFASDKTVCVDVDITQDEQVDDNRNFTLTLTAAQNAVIGDKSSHKVTIMEGNIGPVVALTVEQDGAERDYISADDGIVTITAVIQDANFADQHSLDWFVADDLITDTDGIPTDNVFVFDPSTLATDKMFLFEVTITDDGAPAMSTTQPMTVAFKAIDGPDSLDDMLDNHQLPGQSDFNHHYVLETDIGLALLLGDQAKSSGVEHAILNEVEFSAFAGSELVDTFMSLSGYFDAVVSKLSAPGLQANIVLPLLSEVPSGNVFKVLIDGEWVAFIADENNKIRSARGQEGVCPAVGSELYQPGLTPGDWCVQLTLHDGGLYDVDQRGNGSVAVTSGISSLSSFATVTYTFLPKLKQEMGLSKVTLSAFEIDNGEDVQISGLTLQASGSGDEATHVERVEIWLDENGDNSWDEGDQKLGQGHFSEDDERLVIDFDSSFDLNKGISNILVTYDFYEATSLAD